jgi:hypothetical protein
MDELGNFIDFPSPGNSMYYVYGDSEQYLSESQSPHNSTVSYPTPGSGRAEVSDIPIQCDMASVGRSRYPSPSHEEGGEEEEEATDPTDQQKPAATTKRKRENRYKNAPPAVLSVRSSLARPPRPITSQLTNPFVQRRRAQNRASQRAYRERKDQRIKDLEQMLDDARQRNDVLSQAYTALEAEYVALKAFQTTATTDDPGYHPQPFDVSSYGRAPDNLGLGLGTGIDRVDLDMYMYNRELRRGIM